MQHVKVGKPLSLELWQQLLSELDSATTFQDHAFTFEGPQPATITNELKQVVDDFGTQSLSAVFAVSHGMVKSVWLDPFHNYIAVPFSKANGDEYDLVTIISFWGK